MARAILLVFIETDFVEKLKNKLKGLRASLFTAANVEELEEICMQRVIDVALLDVTQKGNDALGLLSILQQNQPDAQVILVSSQENIATAMEGMRQGASDEITVPFDIDSLKQKIKAALTRRKGGSKGRTGNSSRKKELERHGSGRG